MTDKSTTASVELGRVAFREFMEGNPNPFPLGSLDRMWWWSAFIREAERVRDDAINQWSLKEAMK